MAYDRIKIYQQALKAIEENNLYFAEDVIAFLPCQRSTFYDLFPAGSDELDNIKRNLDENKIKEKVEIRQKLKEGRGAELISLYKLLSTEDELRALNGQYLDHTTKGESIKDKPNLSKLNDDELRAYAELQRKLERD